MGALLDEIIVAAGVGLDGAVVYVDDAVGQFADEMHVVADENQRPSVGLQSEDE